MNAQERALAKAKEKVEEILWESPEGVSISALTGTLRISKPLAISALAAIGAVEQNGVWVLPDDEVVEPEQVAPGAKAEIEPKQLDQSVFDGLPPEYRWAAVDSEGRAYAHKCTPKGATAAYWWCVRGCAAYLIGEGYDTTDWQNSLIERETENPVSEQKQDDATCPRSDRDKPKAKSDYSPVFDNIKGRVLSTIKAHGGATADRLRELTGMHPDDIADALQFMIDHGQLVGREVYFATVYEVAA